MDVDDIRARNARSGEVVAVILDADALRRIDRAVASVAAATGPDVSAALAELVAARVAARDHEVMFRLEACGRDRFDALRSEHPPTEAQSDRFRAAQVAAGAIPAAIAPLAYNVDTFPPALLAECCVEPVISLDEAVAMWSDDPAWSRAELADLFAAALRVNRATRRHDLVARLAVDAQLRDELALCHQWMPHSEFLGWSEDDQDKALAWADFARAEERERCRSCGTRLSDWLDEHGRWLSEPLFEPVRDQCPGCERAHAKREEISDELRPYTSVVFKPYRPPDVDDE